MFRVVEKHLIYSVIKLCTILRRDEYFLCARKSVTMILKTNKFNSTQKNVFSQHRYDTYDTNKNMSMMLSEWREQTDVTGCEDIIIYCDFRSVRVVFRRSLAQYDAYCLTNAGTAYAGMARCT